MPENLTPFEHRLLQRLDTLANRLEDISNELYELVQAIAHPRTETLDAWIVQL